MPEERSSDGSCRREFVKKAGTVILGGAAAAVPLAAGIVVALDPLARAGGNREFVRVASLDEIPADGTPRRFTVLADRTDAWNRYARSAIGAVYLRRTDDGVQALNVICPHFGCFVDYRSAPGSFICPCHNSRFALDGSIASPDSPAARPLDSLEVAIRNDDEVWVKFQNFQTGTPDKIPLA